MAGISNLNCYEGQMRTYKVTCGPHYDADATMAVPEPYWKQFYMDALYASRLDFT